MKWIMVLISSASISGGEYAFKQYERLDTLKAPETNSTLFINTFWRNPITWLCFGIVEYIVLLIIFFAVIVLRKRIVVAIQLIKECGRYAQFGKKFSNCF